MFGGHGYLYNHIPAGEAALAGLVPRTLLELTDNIDVFFCLATYVTASQVSGFLLTVNLSWRTPPILSINALTS